MSRQNEKVVDPDQEKAFIELALNVGELAVYLVVSKHPHLPDARVSDDTSIYDRLFTEDQALHVQRLFNFSPGTGVDATG